MAYGYGSYVVYDNVTDLKEFLTKILKRTPDRYDVQFYEAHLAEAKEDLERAKKRSDSEWVVPALKHYEDALRLNEETVKSARKKIKNCTSMKKQLEVWDPRHTGLQEWKTALIECMDKNIDYEASSQEGRTLPSKDAQKHKELVMSKLERDIAYYQERLEVARECYEAQVAFQQALIESLP